MSSLRSGAALILALVLLTAILLLGLPFIFSQAASLSGTRSFAAQRLAVVGRESVQNLATALAAYAMTPAMKSTSDGIIPPQWTSLAASFSSAPLVSSQYSVTVQELPALGAAQGDGSLGIHATGLGLNGQTTSGAVNTYVGAAITDESGKFDPNTMGPAAWQALLASVKISDWPDFVVYPPPIHTGDYVSSGDTYGQLAKALANIRFGLPGMRITSIDQLLEANPQNLEPGTTKKLRWPLTKPELEKLRPYLSLHNGSGGRAGLQDLGTVLASSTVTFGAATYTNNYWLDSMPDPLDPLLAGGTVLESEAPTATALHGLGIVTRTPQYEPSGTYPGVIWGQFVSAAAVQPWASAGQALMIEATPVLNIHQLSPVMRAALPTAAMLPVTLPASTYNLAYPLWEQPNAAATLPLPLPRPMQANADSVPIESVVPTIAGLWSVQGASNQVPPVLSAPYDLSAFISPTASGNALPALGIMSAGVFSIDASCTITDALNRQVAQDARREIMQAVPQEYLLERRWRTQGDLYALVAQHWGSRVQSWPVGLERLQSTPQTLPDDQDLSLGEANTTSTQTSIRPRQLPDLTCALQTNPNAQQQPPALQEPLEQIYVDWQVGFGFGQLGTGINNSSQSQAAILTSTSLPGGMTNTPPAVASFPPVSGTTAPAGTPPLQDIFPDGVFHEASADLEYPLASNTTGPAILQSALLVPRVSSAPAPPTEINARQISLWIKANSNWMSGIYPILEARMPAANAGYLVSASGLSSPATVQGSAADENYFGLFYDATRQMVVLAIAPPTIENTADSPIRADPFVSSGAPFDETFDHMCRSTTGSLPLAPAWLADGGQGLSKYTAVFQPNRILHCFKTPARTNGSVVTSYFNPNRWVHLQVAMASDRPEGIVLLVDGMVGQDMSKTASHTMANMGDHVTLPTVFLATPIPYINPLMAPPDYGPFIVPSLAVATPEGLPLNSLMPWRGMVRIDDEYIRYEGLDVANSALLNCTRGWRQDTQANSTGPLQSQALPGTQSHPAGALVCAGGYHFSAPGNFNQLYRGGCTLAQNFTPGDTVTPIHKGSVWMYASGPGPGPQSVPLMGNAFLLPVDVLSGNGVPSEFPPSGMVVFDNNYYFYSGFTASGGTGAAISLVPAYQNGTFIPITTTMFPAPAGASLSYTAGTDRVMLVSLAVSGNDPTVPGRYAITATDGDSPMVSLQDTGGRVEWVKYDAIASNTTSTPTQFYFVNQNGFDISTAPISRGMCRTDYDQTQSFQAGQAQVLPVQMKLDTSGHWLSTGDAVTLIPRIQSDAAGPHLPFQMVVRYAGSDGFPVQGGMGVVDIHNDYFSFAEPFPDNCVDLPPPAAGLLPTLAFYISNWDILCGPCWSGADLSPLDTLAVFPTLQPRGQLPRLDAWSTNYGVNATAIDAKIAVAGYVGGAPSGSDATIDDLCAGGLTGRDGNGFPDGHNLPAALNTICNGIQVIWSISGGVATPITQLGQADPLTDVVVAATTPIFNYDFNMGLVAIDGEVFAYQRPSAADITAIASSYPSLTASYPSMTTAPAVPPAVTSPYYARLVARNLLSDGQALTHTIGSGSLPDGPIMLNGLMHCPLLSAIRLPVGPVRQLADSPQEAANGTYNWFGLRDLSEMQTAPGTPPNPVPLNAPAALICASDGTKAEMLQLIGPNQSNASVQIGTQIYNDPNYDKYTTAVWLRGMYNTPSRVASEWQATDPRPIVIGWWPRYPSALPQNLAPQYQAQCLRCRTFPWIGFPFPVLGGYFDATRRDSLPSAFASLPLASITYNADPEFSVEVRALAHSDVWTNAPAPGGAIMDWSLQGASQPAQPDYTAIFAADNDGSHSFSSQGVAQAVDGAEVRVTWRYASVYAPSSRLVDIATAGNVAPQITQVQLRCLAPIRAIANEASR